MTMRTKTNLFGAIAVVLLIPTANAWSASPHQLVKAEAVENDKCRGGSGDDPATQRHCDARDALDAKLKALGWCYGKPGQFGYQMAWHKCD